jgi:hypothetical protein
MTLRETPLPLDDLRGAGCSIDTAEKARMVNMRVAGGSRCNSGTVAPL